MQGPPVNIFKTILKTHSRENKIGRVIYYLVPIVKSSLTLTLWVLILALDYYG